jgi:hypothetical protein
MDKKEENGKLTVLSPLSLSLFFHQMENVRCMTDTDMKG